ncbi:MAG: flagellar motor switch protein FliM [Acidimicrobiia bacterium]
MAAQTATSSSSNRHGKGGSTRRRGEPRPFDFRRPSKLSREHVRTMQIVQETFARGLATMLSSTLRSVSTVSIRSIEQHTYDEYVREVPNPTLLNILSLAPLSGAAILQLPLEVAFCAVELLLGGKGYAEQPARPFTELELQLTRGIIERALPELRYAFEPVVATEPKVMSQESNPQFAQIAAPTDMVIVVSFDIKIESVSGVASLCIPFSSLQPHLEALSATSLYAAQTLGNAAENRALLTEHLSAAPVEISARFRPVVITSGDILALRVGDVVQLGHPVDLPLMLTVEGVATFEATIGRRNRRVAVQVVGPADSAAPGMRPSRFRLRQATSSS